MVLGVPKRFNAGCGRLLILLTSHHLNSCQNVLSGYNGSFPGSGARVITYANHGAIHVVTLSGSRNHKISKLISPTLVNTKSSGPKGHWHGLSAFRFSFSRQSYIQAHLGTEDPQP
jgi:hypothetical protein